MTTAAESGRHAVGGPGEIGLPASAWQMCGIAAGSIVLLAALPAAPPDRTVGGGLLVVHPISTVIRLVADLHARMIGDRDAG